MSFGTAGTDSPFRIMKPFELGFGGSLTCLSLLFCGISGEVTASVLLPPDSEPDAYFELAVSSETSVLVRDRLDLVECEEEIAGAVGCRVRGRSLCRRRVLPKLRLSTEKPESPEALCSSDEAEEAEEEEAVLSSIGRFAMGMVAVLIAIALADTDLSIASPSLPAPMLPSALRSEGTLSGDDA